MISSSNYWNLSKKNSLLNPPYVWKSKSVWLADYLDSTCTLKRLLCRFHARQEFTIFMTMSVTSFILSIFKDGTCWCMNQWIDNKGGKSCNKSILITGYECLPYSVIQTNMQIGNSNFRTTWMLLAEEVL